MMFDLEIIAEQLAFDAPLAGACGGFQRTSLSAAIRLTEGMPTESNRLPAARETSVLGAKARLPPLRSSFNASCFLKKESVRTRTRADVGLFFA